MKLVRVFEGYPQVWNIEIDNYGGPLGYVIQGPTGNCQLYSIACFRNTIIKLSTEDNIKLFSIVWNLIGKTMLFVDIRSSELNEVQTKLNDSGVVLKTMTFPYVSTNGRSMTQMTIFFDKTKLEKISQGDLSSLVVNKK